MYTLKDKVVAITGASSGIGLALAAEALNRGAKIAVCARNLEKLQASLPQLHTKYHSKMGQGRRADK